MNGAISIFNTLKKIIKESKLKKTYYKRTFWGFTLCPFNTVKQERGGIGVSSIACQKCGAFISDDKEKSFVTCTGKCDWRG
jgi:hypothetical protein